MPSSAMTRVSLLCEAVTEIRMVPLWSLGKAYFRLFVTSSLMMSPHGMAVSTLMVIPSIRV